MTTEQAQETTTTTEATETTDTTFLGGQESQGGEGQQATEQVTTPATVATPDDYSVEIEGFNFDEFKAIDENKEFLKEAHEAGLSNEQLGFVLNKYNQIIPEVMAQMGQMQTETCKETLQKEWGAETQANIGLAIKAAQAAGLSGEEIQNPTIGNNPTVIKLLAHFGKQLSEDVPPQNTQQSSGEDVQELMRSEAYSNASHPDHKRVTEQVNRWYAKQYVEN
ncbi:hypothetical protein [Acinetobacter nosocomialis]|uniref:hypothetical protein n=1 Tax=Acinetobacter nosocomialis TaxID=106654 RepID=UPI0024DED9A1|nr:hypothetical protein [Acinetobacter nosocomialis]